MPRTVAKNTDGSKDYKAYAEKPITDTMSEFAAWLKDVTGYKVDPRSVSLAGTLRMDFQKYMRENGSPRAHTGTRKPAAAKPAARPAAKSTATKPAAKPAAKSTKAATPAKPAAKRGTTKPAAPRSGRRGAKPAGEAVEAPY